VKYDSIDAMIGATHFGFEPELSVLHANARQRFVGHDAIGTAFADDVRFGFVQADQGNALRHELTPLGDISGRLKRRKSSRPNVASILLTLVMIRSQ